jgi:hypothetical protein
MFSRERICPNSFAHRIVLSIVLKKYRKINEKRHFLLKRLAVFNAIFSDSAKRAVDAKLRF